MKRIILIVLSVFILISCKVLYGENYAELAKRLSLGMTKSEVLGIMGSQYIVENLSETFDGKLEAILYNNYVHTDSDYVIVFLDDRLVEVNNVPRLRTPQQKVTITKDAE